MKTNLIFNRNSRQYNRGWLLILMCLLAAAQQIPGQQAAAQLVGATSKTQTDRRVRITVAESGAITLKAKNVLSETLAEELSRKLGVTIVSSPLLRGRNLTLEFADLSLEQAARLLAPHARIDYVHSRANDGAPRPVAVYLSGYNEPEPLTVRSVESQSLAVVIEGDTETLGEAAKEENLKINFDDNRLTVLARRQNLPFVVSEIAARANLEFDLRYDSDRLIDVEIRDEPLIEALVNLSPRVRVYVRRDLLTERQTPFRVSLSKQD